MHKAQHCSVACTEFMQNPDVSPKWPTKLTGCRMGELRCIDGGVRTIEVQTPERAGHRIGKHSVKLSDREKHRETKREREKE